METQKKQKLSADLSKKFKKVLATPASFNFYVAIHDFIGFIEANSILAKGLSNKIKINKELDMLSKYVHLRKIYQGLEDMNTKSTADLGHERYMALQDLNRIQNNQLSDTNSFWKKRELSRKLAGMVYERLNVYLS
jgi:hypothetical protein